MTPWLLVAGDVMPVGGMDSANYALANYLAADPRVELHLVTHRAWRGLVQSGRVTVHQAWRPLGSHFLGTPFMARVGRYWARRLKPRGGRVVVNGGNCQWSDVSWVHYVHAAYAPGVAQGPYRLKDRLRYRHDLANERSTLARVRLVVCNSQRTRRDVIERLNVPESRARVVYYGVDARRFALTTRAERADARERLGWREERPVAVFIGALGDRRKGFDTLFDAWCELCRDPAWDCNLAVVGAGAELSVWRQRTLAAGLDARVRFLGFQKDVEKILAACNVLVHPARYEAYGLGVHEALCRGLPALVSADAGVAERYPVELAELLIADPDSPVELAERLRAWRRDMERIQAMVVPFSHALRERTWEDMAGQLVQLVESAA